MDELSTMNEDGQIDRMHSVSEMTNALLTDLRKDDIPEEKSFVLPIAQLATLGAGVASLIPAFNTVTQTKTVGVEGLYKIVNSAPGDVLKVAKDGYSWAALKGAKGASKLAKLAPANPVAETTKMVMNANPTTMMMAVALASIEKELANMAEISKEILSFLETESESEMEADVITLNEIISKYKYNWDNKLYVSSNHKMVCDLQRTARKNLLSRQKRIEKSISEKSQLPTKKKVESKRRGLQKHFKYYRLAIYTFSLASFAEIMLSENFSRDNIDAAIEEIKKYSIEYQELFGNSSTYLEKMVKSSIESNFFKGIGNASSAVGGLIGGIPLVKEAKADEFLKGKGKKIKKKAIGMKEKTVDRFSEVSNPNTDVFLNRLTDMKRIYSEKAEICFDEENIYLIPEE